MGWRTTNGWWLVVAGLAGQGCGNAPPPPAAEPEPSSSPVVALAEPEPVTESPPLYDEDEAAEEDDLFTYKPREEEPPPRAPEGELPQACEDYLAMMAECMKAQQLPPEAQAALQESAKAMREALLAAGGTQAMNAMVEGCRQALDALSQVPLCGGPGP